MRIILLMLLSIPFLNSYGSNLSSEEIQEILMKMKFSCDALDGKPCPQGLARMLVLNPEDSKKSYLCSGFMLEGSNKIVTNHHCFATQKECESTYVNIYNGQDFEVAKCKHIIKSTLDHENVDLKSIDVTIFELDRKVEKISGFSTSNNSLIKGQTQTVWAQDQIDLYQTRIVEIQCQYDSSPDSMILNNCSMIFGNSGSPVLDEFGKVTGIIWGSDTEFEIDTPLEQRRSSQDKSFATVVKHFE